MRLKLVRYEIGELVRDKFMEGFLEEVKDCEFFFKYNEIFRKGLS